MKILLHICCAPCSISPLRILREADLEVMGFFYRHNIHPFSECLKRQQAVEEYSHSMDLRVIYQDGYELENFLQSVAFRESARCTYCYHDRLRSTALLAKRGKFDYFTSTLLYSKFQKHDEIKELGEALGRQVGVPFYYYDFRAGWQEGINESKRLGLYRQQYCGCIYSEKERFYKTGR